MKAPCPHCNTPLPADAPRGLCPACLLRAALPESSLQTTLHTAAQPESPGPDAAQSLDAAPHGSPGEPVYLAEGNLPAATLDQAKQAMATAEDTLHEALHQLLAQINEQTEKIAWTLPFLDSLRQEDVPPDAWAALESLKKKRAALEAARAGAAKLEAKLGMMQRTTVDQRSRLARLFERRLPDLELIDFLGAGGMGEVWLAEHRGLGRQVAVKLLAPDVARDPGFAERFRREAHAMARLDHPHVVRVYDFGESEGVFYPVMEYHPGTLQERLAGGPLHPAKALEVMLPLCSAVSAVHRAGLVHRDLKPANVLLNDRGLKLADFGLALSAREAAPDGATRPHAGGRLTEAGAVVGTPAYLAPEQWRSPNTVDARADVYALGLILAELLTGQIPRGRYTPPSAVCGDRRFDRVVARALQPDPAQRHQTVGELREDLESIRKTSRLEQWGTDFGVLAFVAFWAYWTWARLVSGLPVTGYWGFPIFYAPFLFFASGSGYRNPVRAVAAAVSTVGLLGASLATPVLGLPRYDEPPWFWEACGILIGILAPSMIAERFRHHRAGCLVSLCLLGLTLTGIFAPGFEALGRWMPLVLAVPFLTACWMGMASKETTAAPLVESPFGA